MTCLISKSVDSPAGDSLSEYQKGVLCAREFLRAVLARAAVGDSPTTGAADASENHQQQR